MHTRYSVTHGVTAVAELKDRLGRTINNTLLGVTHGVTAVAELKGLRAGTLVAADSRHPRRHRRGRIEGRKLLRYMCLGGGRHPRRHRRGRIEGGADRSRDERMG